ncbi:MAG: hypothetical protein ABSD74_19200 [Rhizomicrobium sp.]|jgi:hypothetical protein
MWPFGSKHFLDEEDEAWHLQSWVWMLKNFGGLTRLKSSPLVRPTGDFFPPTDARGHARAEHIFACVKQHAGMTDWPCQLIAQPESSPLKVGELASLEPVSGSPPLGTFGVERGGEVTITYDPAKLSEPMTLVATFAHELAHYLLATVREEAPGGHEMHEYATDLMTVFLGFGMFGANGSFNFSQFHSAGTHGWQWSRAGYLRERDWAFALAAFLMLRGEETGSLKPLLKRHLYSDMNVAYRRLQREPALLDGLHRM